MTSLFTLRVRLPECGGEPSRGRTRDSSGEDAEREGGALARSDGARGEAGDAEEVSPWRPLAFSAGNPRAEIIHGELHLFRDTLTGSASSSEPTGHARDDADALPRGRNPTVCVLAVPSSISVGDFCRFVAAFAPKMMEMRMVAPRSAGESKDEDLTGRPTGRPTGPRPTETEPALTRETAFETSDGTGEAAGDARASPSSLPAPGSSYAVIVRFVDQTSADAFVHNYHNRKFNAFCEEKCRALFVRRVEVTTETGNVAASAAASADDDAALVELPSCPVCLDRLDTEASGVVTTVCSHAFHASCMSHWEDNSCPVCRYTASPESATACAFPGCGKTSETAALWACLICGRVGCGRYDGKHSLEHWRETGHCYAMELRTQRVWDYVRDGFVHRLIQSKAGLVELTRGARVGEARRGERSGGDASVSGDVDGASLSKRRGGGGGGSASLDHGLGAEYDDEYPLDPGLEEALVSSKLDAIHAEYSALLASQLDSQRRYFEGLVAAAAAEKEGALSAAAAAERQAEVIAGAVRDAREARRELKATRAERDARARAAEALEEENAFLRSVNDALTLNRREAERDAAAAAAGLSSSEHEKNERIRELEEQVRDLMVFLDAREKAEAAAAVAPDAADGSGNDARAPSGASIRGGSVLGVGPGPAVAGADDAPSRSDTHARLQKKLAARQAKRGG